jgi:hypothetical protein
VNHLTSHPGGTYAVGNDFRLSQLGLGMAPRAGRERRLT